MKRLLWYLPLSLLLLAPFAAMASDGYVIGSVSLRAGPDTDYPRITVLDAGTHVSIRGCIDDWEWCDVTAYGERGWVAGRYVQYEYEGRRVYLHDYGSRIGIPIVSFVLGAYWGEHYHDRPWYRHRDSWSSSSHGHRPHYSYPMQYARARTSSSGDRHVIGRTAPAQTYTPRPGPSREVIGLRSDSRRVSGSRVTTQQPSRRSAESSAVRARSASQQARVDTARQSGLQEPQSQQQPQRQRPAERQLQQQQQQHPQQQHQQQQRTGGEAARIARQSQPAARSAEGQGHPKESTGKAHKDNKDKNDH